jgi:hypothetical protein
MKKKVTKVTPLEKHKLITPPPYTEGHWEDELGYWENYQPSSNMGKWWITIQLEKLKNKIKSYQ